MPITEQEKQSRLRAIQGAEAINAIGGGPPPSGYDMQLYTQWANGEITHEEMKAALKEHCKRITEETNHASLTRTSRYISLILRHKPETIGITLDEHGWADVGELIAGISRTHPLTMELLEEIVRTDGKQRYSFNGDKTLIRANQGHSVPVDVELPELEPPAILYHGTGRKYVASIDRQGLLPKSRLYVHLSADADTAVAVGKRHGAPVVYEVQAGKMMADGYAFYRSVNGVWLTKEVPAGYLAMR